MCGVFDEGGGAMPAAVKSGSSSLKSTSPPSSTLSKMRARNEENVSNGSSSNNDGDGGSEDKTKPTEPPQPPQPQQPGPPNPDILENLDDLGSSDEVKVFKDEDEVDGNASESHQAELLAEKSSLITESEQVLKIKHKYFLCHPKKSTHVIPRKIEEKSAFFSPI